MNIKRFTAPTAREALAKARMAFGDGTLILSNRAVAGGVEVMATGEESLDALHQQEAAAPAPAARPAPKARAAQPALAAAARSTPQEDADQMQMSTLSFQDYVRDRMLRRRQEAGRAEGDFASRTGMEPAPVQRAAPAPAQQPQRAARPANTSISRAFADEMAAEPREARAPRQARQPEPAVLAAQPAQSPAPALMAELQSMKELIEDRFNTLAWLGQAKQDPIQSNLMLKLIRAGYSPALSRALLERMPDDLGAADAVRWLMGTLERNVKTDAGLLPLHQEGGIFALCGATGVGKTTTAAKLAAQCVRAYGANSVGLITLDSYRIGAHEQLRAYGRMLGVVAHLAHDRAALGDMLNLLSAKKLTIIDTTGVAPRDPRCRDMLDVLDLPRVQRLTVLNAGSHGDTLDEVLAAYKPAGGKGAGAVPQQAILTKVDEAAKLGPVLDTAIRHQLTLRGVTNGQRVPEDWEQADAEKLVRMSMRSPAKSAFDPKVADLSFFFSQPAGASAGGYDAAGAHHA